MSFLCIISLWNITPNHLSNEHLLHCMYVGTFNLWSAISKCVKISSLAMCPSFKRCKESEKTTHLCASWELGFSCGFCRPLVSVEATLTYSQCKLHFSSNSIKEEFKESMKLFSKWGLSIWKASYSVYQDISLIMCYYAI